MAKPLLQIPSLAKIRRQCWGEQGVETMCGGCQWSSINKGMAVMQIKSLPSLLIRVSKDLITCLFWHRDGYNFINGDNLYTCKCLLQKSNFYLVFRASPRSALS